MALVTFDGRIVGEAKPNDGPVHRLRIVERLMEAMNLVDEDLTELTDSELVAAVARYLLLQEGIDARLRRAPPIDDPLWNELAASPSGELYDLRVVHQAVAAALERHRTSPARAACDRAAAPAPLLPAARHRAALPRRTPEAGRRARGLGAALERAAAARGSQRIVVLSDLQGLEGDLGAGGARGAPGAAARPPPDLRGARGARRADDGGERARCRRDLGVAGAAPRGRRRRRRARAPRRARRRRLADNATLLLGARPRGAPRSRVA